jgi:hypothetical protein
MKTAALWNFTSCGVVTVDRAASVSYSEDGGSIYLENVTVNIYRTTGRHIEEDSILYVSMLAWKELLMISCRML